MTLAHLAGLVETLATLFGDVAGICMNSEENADMKGPMNMLLTLLETLHSVLKHVSDVVRKALQVSAATRTGLGRGFLNRLCACRQMKCFCCAEVENLSGWKATLNIKVQNVTLPIVRTEFVHS